MIKTEDDYNRPSFCQISFLLTNLLFTVTKPNCSQAALPIDVVCFPQRLSWHSKEEQQTRHQSRNDFLCANPVSITSSRRKRHVFGEDTILKQFQAADGTVFRLVVCGHFLIWNMKILCVSMWCEWSCPLESPPLQIRILLLQPDSYINIYIRMTYITTSNFHHEIMITLQVTAECVIDDF